VSTNVSRTATPYRGPDLAGQPGAATRGGLSRPGTPLSDEDYKDIQGLVRFGYAHLKAARFHLLTIADASSARAWLSRAPVTSAVKHTPPEVALNVALTHGGLAALGTQTDVLAQFPYEFISGMNEPSRSRRLGDVGANDPQWWRWGGSGEKKIPHVLVMTYATTDERLAQFEAEVMDSDWKSGFATLTSLSTKDIGDIEPFGFNDGISQPVIDWERQVGKRHDTAEYTNISALGEVLLGYPNEYGKYTNRPLVDPPDDLGNLLPPAEDAPEMRDLARNGTYLVLRDLVQDAPAFWHSVNTQAAEERQSVDRAAAATVGRVPFDVPAEPVSDTYVPHTTTPHDKPPGTPLAPLSSVAIPGVGENATDAQLNQFTFHSDRNGDACPYGAHIRRANPRNADLPQGTRGLFAWFLRTLGFGREHPHDDLIASTRFHRILRRGREYVIEASDDHGAPTVQRGLRFICLNANISRQFEFIQTSWLAFPKFEGLDEGDPLLGTRTPMLAGRATDTFTRSHNNGVCSRSGPLPQFVRVVGGAYFFLPSLPALRYLSR